MGSVVITVEQTAVDDTTPGEEIAYVVESVDGDPSPFPDEPVLPHPSSEDVGKITLVAPTFAADFRARMRVIPVDAGGNEGPASNVVEIGFGD